MNSGTSTVPQLGHKQLQLPLLSYWKWRSESRVECVSQWWVYFKVGVLILFPIQMLLISAAGLLNVAILSMTHEHQGYFGCQLTYATLGFALFTPGAAHLFEYLKEFKILW